MAGPGTSFDGELRSAPGFDRARVRFDVKGLIIERDGVEAPLIWPYASIASGAGPAAGATSATITIGSSASPGAMLTVASDLFRNSLLQAAPHLRPARRRGPDWGPLAWTSAALLAGIALLVWLVFALFPYKTIARSIPEETRVQIGQLALVQITKGHRKCASPAGDAALRKLVDRLAQASGTDIRFKVQVHDWSLVNAFAVMGNQIVLTRGLLGSASSPDEIAGVLGHEMGHSIEVHPESAVLRALGTAIAIQVAIGGWSPDIISEAATQLLLLRHSRANETEADEVALRILKEARIAPGPFAGFFEKLAKRQAAAKGTSVPDIFATHPPLPERAKRAASQPPYPATPALDPADWDALRKICGG